MLRLLPLVASCSIPTETAMQSNYSMRREPFHGRPSDPDNPSYYNQTSEWISPTYNRLTYTAPSRQRSEAEQESAARGEQDSASRDDEQERHRLSCSEASSVEYAASGAHEEEDPRPWRRRMLSKCMRNK